MNCTPPNILLQRTSSRGLAAAELRSFGGVEAWLVVLALVAFHAIAVAAERPCVTGSITKMDGKWYQPQIFPEQLKATATWNPRNEPTPPLAAGKALEIAARKLHQLFPKISDWQVRGISLGWAWSPEHWYYSVNFNRAVSLPPNSEIPSFTILVLMSGMAIEPTTMPAAR